MKKFVLDTHSVIAYLEGEDSGKGLIPVLENAIEGKAEIFFSIINWGELYYIALREGGRDRAELYRETISKFPIMIINVDEELTLAAANFKAFYKMSYADAFAAGLASLRKATLVTGDKDFKQVENKIKVLFLE
jgi:uncharacterized protein